MKRDIQEVAGIVEDLQAVYERMECARGYDNIEYVRAVEILIELWDNLQIIADCQQDKARELYAELTD